MKKILLILLVLIIGVGLFFYFGDKNSLVQNKNVLEKTNETVLVQEKAIGDMVVEFPKENLSSFSSNDSLVVDFKQEAKKYDLKDFSLKKENFYLGVSLSQNENQDQLQIKDWFEKNTPEQEKQSVYSATEQKEKIVGSIPSYEVRYAAQIQLTGGFYDLITLYIPHNADIYEISYYAIPVDEVDPTFSLSQDERQDVLEYTQIVDKIIESIKFVR